MTIPDFSCGACPLWQHDPGLKPAAQNHGNLTPPRAGHCRLNPPQMMIVPVQSRISQQMEVMTQRLYPQTFDHETCGQNPRRWDDKFRRLVTFAISAWDNRLTYKPGENRDEIAGGFSRMPSLTEAKEHAVAWHEKPADPARALTDEEMEALARQDAERRKNVLAKMQSSPHAFAAGEPDPSLCRRCLLPKENPVHEPIPI